MSLKHLARTLFTEAMLSIRVPEAMRERVRYRNGMLHLGEFAYDLAQFRQILVVAAGKAAAPMCETMLPILDGGLGVGQRVSGVVVGVSLSQGGDGRMLYLRGGHPLPDEDSERAADAILKLLAGADETTLVLFLMSGGASAMVEKPMDGSISLAEMADFHGVLVRSGMPIAQMNALRKHVSRVKGGRLAMAARGAAQCTLLISDVPSDRLDAVGSGPSLPDSSTIADCCELLVCQADAFRSSERIVAFLQGTEVAETPKADHPAFLRARWMTLLSSEDLCRCAARLAEEAGFFVVVDNGCDEWEYRLAASYLIDRVTELRRVHAKVCVVSAGEVLVQVPERHGSGGRNQQFVLECVRLIAERGLSMTVLSGGSDGVDGNSPATGAVGDETTWGRASALGWSVEESLWGFDSFSLFEALGDAIWTGPTGNNVRDLRMLFSDAVGG